MRTYLDAVDTIINNIPISDFENYFMALFDKLNETNKMVVSFDDVMLFATDAIRIAKRDFLYEPVDPRFAALLFGHNCHVGNLVRCAYYYALKFCNDFEEGVLTAVNSGGNNMARSALTGGLIGAMVGIKGIPQRFIDGLINDPGLIPEGFKSQGEYLLSLISDIVKNNNGAVSEYKVKLKSDCGC